MRARPYPALRAALDALPGWGPVTVRLFLRELRGVWPGADPPLDGRGPGERRRLPGAESIRRFHILDAEFTIGAELTRPRHELDDGLVRQTP